MINEIEKRICLENNIPLISLSSEERLISILSFRNDRRLYRRKCDFSNENIISSYRSDIEYKVIKSSLWWQPNWDALNFGFIPDSNRDFFEQFNLLQKKVPKEGTSVVNSENSEYNSHTRDSKNVYLSHLVARSEDVLYSYWSVDNKDLSDCNYAVKSTSCYDCNYISNCYECTSLEESSNSNNCFFSFQLRNCNNCILCSNLNNKSYHIMNKPYSIEEYNKIKKTILNNYHKTKKQYIDLKSKSYFRYMHSLNCEDVSGEHIQNSKNCHNCFDILNSQDCYNHTNGGGIQIVHGYSVGFPECQNVYCSLTLRNCQDIFFSMNCWSCYNLWYCDSCVSCKDCFACVGLKHKQYCFFNKQYSKSEYEIIVKQWKEIMSNQNNFGHFFPQKYSPFYYNESTAQDFFPKSKQELLDNNMGWLDFPEKLAGSDATDAKICITCNSNFKLIKREQVFYQNMGIGEPEVCPDCRLNIRLLERNPYKLLVKNCSKCNVSINTSSQSSNILCDKCYLDLLS